MSRKIQVVPGEKYGELTVVKEIKPRISPSGNKVRRVLCTCSCDGKEVETDLSELRRGRKTSCGCVAESKKLRVFPGEVYGRLTVIEETEIIKKDGKKVRGARCKCSCGNPNDVVVRLYSLLNGESKSCGCYHKEKISECSRKYNDFYINHDTGIVTGKTEKGEEFYFDAEDIKVIEEHYWRIDSNGYVVTTDKKTRKAILMHRLLMNCPEDKVVDHINHCKSNNCKSNLRICTQTENSMNRLKSNSNTSGITGISWENEKWRSRIMINGKHVNLGYFSNKQDAIEARLKAELELFGEYSPNYQKLTQQQSDQQSQQNT